MTIKTILRLPHHLPRPSNPTPSRLFVTLPGLPSNTPTVLHEKRILPYAATTLYDIIADIDSYSLFLPYCSSSRVTHWSNPTPTLVTPASPSTAASSSASPSTTAPSSRRWPARANLRVGWAGYDECFTSRVLCSPGNVVEALCGEATTSQPGGHLMHYGDGVDGVREAGSVFKMLATRWNVREMPSEAMGGRETSGQHTAGKKAGNEGVKRPMTEVSLRMEFAFANPLYAALSKAVAPRVAEVMIEAFEKRARTLAGDVQEVS